MKNGVILCFFASFALLISCDITTEALEKHIQEKTVSDWKEADLDFTVTQNLSLIKKSKTEYTGFMNVVFKKTVADKIIEIEKKETTVTPLFGRPYTKIEEIPTEKLIEKTVEEQKQITFDVIYDGRNAQWTTKGL